MFDLDVVAGERLTAIFTSGEPHQKGFEVEKADTTWLLRSADAEVKDIIRVVQECRGSPMTGVRPPLEPRRHSFLKTLPGWEGSLHATMWPVEIASDSASLDGQFYFGFTR